MGICFRPGRGSVYRFTRVNQCCAPQPGQCSQVATDKVASLEFSAQTNDVDPITQTLTNGQTCEIVPGFSELSYYELSIGFCGINTDLYELITGTEPVLDYTGNTGGFRVSSGTALGTGGFAMEMWLTEASSGPCDPNAAGRWLYGVVPCITKGRVGDFEITGEDAIDLPLSGNTRGGGAWCRGPYDVVPQDGTGTAGPLIDPVMENDHMYFVWTDIAPPADGCDCAELAFDDLGCESPAA